MTMIDRRTLLITGTLGVSALALPAGRLAAQALAARTGFTHNVASGDPGPDSMLLWTRYVDPKGGPAKVRVEVSDSQAFTRIVGGGQMVTGPWRDHTVKITVDGLRPGAWHWYRFIAPDGSISPIGRTRTLPVGKVNRFGLGIFSCSNLGFGEFNAYGHGAARQDMDLWVHLGDYIYEYGPGGYDAGSDYAKRIMPDREILTFADYRLRYASYRMDPHLQALHANFPMIPSPDDHESTNDSWEGGAQNHQAEEGEWGVRKAIAAAVWREWLPVGEEPWKAYPIGTLATYFRTEMRTTARSAEPSLAELLRKGDAANVLAQFRDGAWRDAAATMMGSEQEHWLHTALASHKPLWAVVGSGTNMGYVTTPSNAMDWLTNDADPRAKFYMQAGLLAAKAGLPFNFDNWGGYPAARSRLLAAAQRGNANLIAITGDSHNAWAFDLPEGGKPAGVEFGGHSVTSPGFESNLKGATPDVIARDLVAGNKAELRWADMSQRGYMHLTLTPQAATNEWVFMESILKPTLATASPHRLKVRPGRRVLEAA